MSQNGIPPNHGSKDLASNTPRLCLVHSVFSFKTNICFEILNNFSIMSGYKVLYPLQHMNNDLFQT